MSRPPLDWQYAYVLQPDDHLSWEYCKLVGASIRVDAFIERDAGCSCS